MTSKSRKALRAYFDLIRPEMYLCYYPDEIADMFDDLFSEARKKSLGILLQEFPVAEGHALRGPECEIERMLNCVYGWLQDENELTFANFTRQFEQYYQKMQKHWEEIDGLLV